MATREAMTRVKDALHRLVWSAIEEGDGEACGVALAALAAINDLALARGWDLDRFVGHDDKAPGAITYVDFR